MSYDNYEVIDSENASLSAVKSFFSNVYLYMFVALGISGFIAWYASSQEWYLTMMYNFDPFTGFATGISTLGYVIMFAPLALVLLIQFGIQKMSYGLTLFLYIVYSVLIGLSLSSIFLVYTSSSIALTFFVTAGAFGAMALLGYTTKTDLSKMGSLLYMVFFGMFIASIANIWLGSDTIGWVVSFLGLFVFTGLTAWEMQRLKIIAQDGGLSGEEKRKMELLGGLKLYILFINLFLSILRFMGDR